MDFPHFPTHCAYKRGCSRTPLHTRSVSLCFFSFFLYFFAAALKVGHFAHLPDPLN